MPPFAPVTRHHVGFTCRSQWPSSDLEREKKILDLIESDCTSPPGSDMCPSSCRLSLLLSAGKTFFGFAVLGNSNFLVVCFFFGKM